MALIRVFEIPPAEQMANSYLFGGGMPVIFTQVDWFRDDEHPLHEASERDYRGFIAKKRYAESAALRGAALLVLGPRHSFTIGLEAP
jgi:hypothetical protein